MRRCKFKARVHNGRLVLDEPTDLPEGEVIYLQPVDGRIEIDKGLAAARAGDHVDAQEFVTVLLGRS